jgi:hypothetical protein
MSHEIEMLLALIAFYTLSFLWFVLPEPELELELEKVEEDQRRH